MKTTCSLSVTYLTMLLFGIDHIASAGPKPSGLPPGLAKKAANGQPLPPPFVNGGFVPPGQINNPGKGPGAVKLPGPPAQQKLPGQGVKPKDKPGAGANKQKVPGQQKPGAVNPNGNPGAPGKKPGPPAQRQQGAGNAGKPNGKSGGSARPAGGPGKK